MSCIQVNVPVESLNNFNIFIPLFMLSLALNIYLSHKLHRHKNEFSTTIMPHFTETRVGLHTIQQGNKDYHKTETRQKTHYQQLVTEKQQALPQEGDNSAQSQQSQKLSIQVDMIEKREGDNNGSNQLIASSQELGGSIFSFKKEVGSENDN